MAINELGFIREVKAKCTILHCCKIGGVLLYEANDYHRDKVLERLKLFRCHIQGARPKSSCGHRGSARAIVVVLRPSTPSTNNRKGPSDKFEDCRNTSVTDRTRRRGENVGKSLEYRKFQDLRRSRSEEAPAKVENSA